MHLLRLLAMIAWVALTGPVAADEAADRAEIEAATQAWFQAFNARDSAGLIKLLTPDVVLLDPNIPSVVGIAAARKTLEPASNTARDRLNTVTKELVVAGDVAWRIGTLAHTRRSGEVVSRGQSLEIWQRTLQGWRLHRQMSSGLLSPSPQLSRPPLDEPVLDAPRN